MLSQHVRDLVGYGLYRCLGFVVKLLPRRVMVWLGRRLGGLYYLVARRDRRVGLENLRRVFPDRDDHAAMLKESVRLQAVAILDILWSRRLNEHNAHELVDLRPGTPFRDFLEAHEGVVVAAAHYGSWEMVQAASRPQGIRPATIIAREVDNPLIDRHVRKVRERLGNHLTYREGAVRDCVAALRRGEIAVSVIDMAITSAQGGVYVDFLGTPAMTSLVLPTLAVRRKAPLGFMATRPIDKGLRYVIEFEPIEVDLGADRDAETLRLARAMNAALERLIRKHPEPWLWTYKRWKYRPTELPSGYPSYSLWLWPEDDGQASTVAPSSGVPSSS